MLLWLTRSPWLSTAFIALSGFLVLGGIDLALIGPLSLLSAIFFAGSVIATRLNAWVATTAVALGTSLIAILDTRPGFASGLSLVTLWLIALIDTRMRATISYGVTILAGIALVLFLTYGVGLNIFGFQTFTANAEALAALVGIAVILSSTTLFYLVGLWLQTLTAHVGSRFDRVVSRVQSSKLQLELAEQNARFDIAKDISELVVQRLTAALTIAEAASYSVRGQSGIAERSIEQVTSSVAAAHEELRRLYDMLGKADAVHAAPPSIENLNELVVIYRELGYGTTLTHLGQQQALDEGQSLAIYRIVFDALENVREHVPLGADVTIDFTWVDNGLQVLIKDNGIEYSNRVLGLTGEGYSASDDQRALTEAITGAGLTAMRERASLYSGSVEFSRVPGVGFTVSAIFPKLFRR
ncbi:MAG: hypothetical protein RLZZ164_978 [Actinomycetota bacterium]|jgi:signal transduction histidine kinase